MSDIIIEYDLWDGDDEGVLSRWFYAAGEKVASGNIVCEIMVEKVTFELEAPADGVLSIDIEEECSVVKGVKIGAVI